MTDPWHILANGDEPAWAFLLRLLPWIAVIAVGLLIRIIVGAARRRQAQEQKERWDEIRRQRAGAQPRQAGRAVRPPARPAQEEQPSAAEVFGRAIQRAMGVPEQLAPRPPVLQPVTPLPAAELRMEAPGPSSLGLEPGRKRAAQTGPGPAADRMPESPQARGPATAIEVKLIDADRARRAIVHHEIFSAPKALRGGPEMWEL
jgi:hypothetical protein